MTGRRVDSLRVTVDPLAVVGGVESGFGVEVLAEFDMFIIHDKRA